MDSQPQTPSYIDGEEINPLAVVKALHNLFIQTFPDLQTLIINVTESERVLASKLFDAYSDILGDFRLQADDVLNLSEMVAESTCDRTDDVQLESQESVSWKPMESQDSQTVKPIPKSSVSMERKTEIVELWKNHPKWKLTTLRKNGAKELKSYSTLYKWKDQVNRGSNSKEKYTQIDAYVIQQLMVARESFKIVRSSHLKHWGLQKSLQFADFTLPFKASQTWLTKFKRRHNISSRKITRLVSKRELKSADQIADEAKQFQLKMKSLIPTYPPNLVFNTDQCGFSYELLSQRTLNKKGAKTIFGYAQSPTNLATHSYTVQYIINVAGEVFPKVYLCLQEKNGKLGPWVKVDIESSCPSNVFLTCSASGKLSTSLTEYFLRGMIAEKVEDDFVWIVDSWPGHTNIQMYESVFGKTNGKPECLVKVIPEKCTPICQPLDTTFHRQLKNLARELLSALEVLECDSTLHAEDNWTNRKGVIKLQSLLHHQISAPIFLPMVQYCWYSSGLVEEKPNFLNVNQVCFLFDKNDSLICEAIGCQNQRFIKCARCRKRQCLQHFWFENHFDFCEDNTFKF